MLHDNFIEVKGEFAFAKNMDATSIEEIQAFLEESVKDSCEGLMVKMLKGEGSSYEPSKRSMNWLKVLPFKHVANNSRSKKITSLGLAIHLTWSLSVHSTVAGNVHPSMELTFSPAMTRQPKNTKQYVNWEQVSPTRFSNPITTH